MTPSHQFEQLGNRDSGKMIPRIRRAFERYVFKCRGIYAYALQDHPQDERVLSFPIREAPDSFRKLPQTERLQRYLESRKSSSAWHLFIHSESGRILGYSFLHIPDKVEWNDVLPTLPGEARISSTFVEPEFRGKRIRGIILAQQSSYCLQHGLKLWSVIEDSNLPSIKSALRAGGRLIRGNYLVKIVKENVLSILTNPFQIYPIYKHRRVRR